MALLVVLGRDAQRTSRGQRLGDLDVEALLALFVGGRRDVAPVIGKGGTDLIGRGGNDRGGFGQKAQERAKPIKRERRLALDVRARHLRGGRDLNRLSLAQRALGERAEEADRLDLVAEELDARGLVLGGAKEVENASAHGELATIGDLVGAFVAAIDQELGKVVE